MLKSDLPYEPRYRRAAVIVRDPRDVAVSYYHHKIKFREISPSMPIGEFTEQFVA